LNALVSSFKGSADAMNVLLVGNKDKLNGSIDDLSNMTSNFSKLSDSISNSGITETMESLQSTISSLDGVLAKMEKGEGTLGKLMKDEALYSNLSQASKELDLLLQDFRLNPKRYVNVSVFGKKQKDYTLPENDPAENKNN
jgi:phospholipid/cholesterol/gamma-HCH transport system substrate-binding protein